MTIQRTIDSANDGCIFKHTPVFVRLGSVELSGGDPSMLVVVNEQTGRLKLFTYGVNSANPGGKITRLQNSGDDGNQMQQSPAIASVREHGYVTAVCDNHGKLKLIAWQIPDSGEAIKRKADSRNQAGAIKHTPTIVNVDDDEVATATVGHDNRIKLVRWCVAADLMVIQRGGDSGNSGPKTSTTAYAAKLHAQLIAVAFADMSSNLRIQLYRLTSGTHGDPFQEANSGNQAGKINGTLRIVRLHNSLLATVVRTPADRLQVILWRYSNNGDTIERRGDTGDQADIITTTPDIAFIQDGQLVTAVRTQSGGLKITRWHYSNDGRTVTKMTDSGPLEQTGEIACVPSVIVCKNPSQAHWLVTAIATNHGALKLIAWQ